MIEIRKIREFTPKGKQGETPKPKKYDAPIGDEGLFVESISDVFTKTEEIVAKIPESDRWNCYFTLGHKPGVKEEARTWKYQDVIPFDIDNIEYVDDKPKPGYLEAFQKATGVDPKKCVIIATGNGLQILVKPNFMITDVSWFKKNEKYYTALCHKISDALLQSGLKGEMDPSAFEPNRLFRLPQTFNIKPNRPKRIAKTLNNRLETLDINIAELSGLPVVDENDALSEKEIKRQRFDTETIMDQCEFLKWSKANPQNVTEPQWYAQLSIVARLENGEKLAHELSEAHPGYNEKETDRKIQQALDASGPRTCENINKLWGKCQSCPHWKKIVSPISLKGENFIATRDSGFHRIGKKGALIPDYLDLLKFYEQERPFINASKVHYYYQGTFWKDVEDERIDSFAQDHFDPVCNNQKASEFRGIVKRHHIEAPEFFTETVAGKINLANGVLDLKTMKLDKHSTKFGFKYQLPFKFDPIAQAPKFKKFMQDITTGDGALEKILLEYMGYAISGDRPLAEKVLLLTGEGSNGKSTFKNILIALGGNGYRAIKSDQFMNEFHRVNLHGALFNVSEELPKYSESEFWELVKDLASGTELTASRKFKDAFTFTCHAKLIFLTNNLPRGGEPSHGLFRRMLIAPFEARFTKENVIKGLDTQIINEEMSGVLNMVLEAYQRLRENNYQFTESVKSVVALENFKQSIDNVSRWADENIVAGKPESVSPSYPWIQAADSGELVAVGQLMWKEYETWAKAQGEHPVSGENFGRRMKSWLQGRNIPFDHKKMKVDKKSIWVWRGISYQDSSEF
jgi:P4 family phage/plasmid primase-like protien